MTDSMTGMVEQLHSVGNQCLKDVSQAQALDALEQIRVRVLGKKGALSEVLRALGSVSAEERPKIGSIANEWKAKIEAALSERKSVLEEKAFEERIQKERIDVTAPSRRLGLGALHPVTQTTRRIVAALKRLGFEVTTGPEADTEYLTFDAINIPKDHPARDMQDTFFLSPGVVLRTHTSPVQMRTMLARKWPIRILCPGAVYRCDNDATHSPMFHQIEGLWVDKKVKMSDLKGTLEFFAKEVFGSDAKIRLRPSYFPFVEPGAEVDVSCFLCRKVSNPKCPICKGTGWLEILGAGMVHPELFKAAGYDPNEVTGFAFGVGIERVALLLHAIPNIRLLFGGDDRFLRQF